MRRPVSVSKSLLFFLLAIIIFGASLQAKLGLYSPERSTAGITAKTIKLIECRMDCAVAEVSVEPVVLPPIYNPEPESYALEETPVAPKPAPVSGPLWFRPPPELS